MPKGEKIRPKQEMDQLPLENFENSRVRVFVCQNTLVCLLLSIGGVFEIFESISLGTTLFMPQQVCLTLR